jgi:hypothetical protein
MACLRTSIGVPTKANLLLRWEKAQIREGTFGADGNGHQSDKKNNNITPECFDLFASL